MVLGWNYWVHEEQRFVADASAHLAANPTHTITERFLDDDHPGGISYVDFTPSGSNQYIRVDTEVYCISVTGNNLTITPSGGPTVIAGSGEFLPLSGGTMTGDLILDHDPVLDLEAATKQYVDQEIAGISGGNADLEIKDDNVLVDSGISALDFGHALDVTDEGGGEMLIDVDESEFTTVVFITGNQTISGNKTFANDVGISGALTLSGNPTNGNQAVNKDYVDQQVAAAAGNPLAIEDDDSEVLADTLRIDFGHAIDVTSGAGQEAEVSVDESEFTTVVFLTGDQVISGNKTFADNVTIDGDLTVNGTTTTINTEELSVEDNIIILNSTVTGTPTEDSGIEVERGTETNAQFLWNETTDRWQAGLSGSLENVILESDLNNVANAAKIEVKDDNAQVLADAISLDFGHAIDVTSGAGQEAEIAVDESEFTTVLFLSGGTMTGPLTLSGNPLVDNHAANKLYVDQQIASAVNASKLEVKDDNSQILAEADSLDFGHAIDVVSGAGLEAEIAVDESEFTTVLFLSGGTMSGTLTLAGDPTLSGHAANKNYVDEQVTAVQPTLQVDFTAGTDLDTTQNTLPLSGASAVNVNGGSTYTVNATNVAINQVGYYKVSWSIEAEKIGGSTQRRIVQTNLNFNGSQLSPSTCAAYVRDATNNHGSCSNSYIVEVTSAGQTVGVRTRQTGSGGGSGVTHSLSAGHLLVERLGDN